MSALLEARIAALERRLADLSRQLRSPVALARSTLTADDSDPAAPTVQAQLDALSVRDSIPVLYNFGVTGSPPVGADLHVVYVDGDPSKAAVIASGHQLHRLSGLAPGDSALYDTRGAYVWLAPTGPVVNCAGMPLTIMGDVHVTGRVTGGYGSGDQVTLQTHKHGQGSGGITTPPNAGT